MHWMSEFNPDSHEQDQCQWLNQVLQDIQNHYSSPHLWIDVGANRGLITDCFIEQGKFTNLTWAFEPHQELYNSLVNRYQSHSNVHIFNKACSNYTGITNFYSQKHDTGLSFIKSSPETVDLADFDLVKVPVTKLDDMHIPSTHCLSFIKIDAEGTDFLILQGAKNTLLKHRPIVLFEFSGLTNCVLHNYTASEWYKFFKDLNYNLYCPIGGHDEKFIIQHFSKFTPELKDLIAIPTEYKLL